MFNLSKLIIASLLTVYSGFPITIKAQELNGLIGINYPPLPQGIDEIAGWVIKDPYGIDHISIEGQEFLLLSRLTKTDSRGNPFFEVVNVLPLPPINLEIEEVLSGSFCRSNGQKASSFIVIIKSEEDQQYLTKVRKAWRVEGENFVEVNPQSLSFQCENFGYDI